MRSILGNLNYIFLVLFCLAWQCKQSTQSTKTNVTIDDIWLSDYVDNDEDGYWSNADINIALSTNKSSTEIFVEYSTNEAMNKSKSESRILLNKSNHNLK
jgi:hypothetical protein